MPRVDARVRCTFGPGVNADSVGNALSEVIRALTGSPCQVILNKRDTGIGRMQMWKMQKGAQRGNIEIKPPQVR